MNIELNELVTLISAKNSTPSAPRNLGMRIVVLERGFVYVGNVSVDDDFVTVINARNIRRWGTTAGLGELVNGPLKDTKVDPCGDLLIPLRAVIHFIQCQKGW
jgi:hypothetical protein